MSKIYVPCRSAAEWQHFLAEPDKQWRTGFSAKTLAHSWQNCEGLPPEIASMLKPQGRDVELLLAIPEYKVALRGSSLGASQNDVFALVRVDSSTFAIMVEGKVNEPFGEKLGQWLHDASDGKRKRLEYLCKILGLTQPLPDDIPYQLLHRTASAIIEAERFKTDAAAMIVHSFSKDKLWFNSFERFSSLFGVAPKPDDLFVARPDTKPPLYLGWACGDCTFLTA
jgi:hypothetical protein